ncbi:unnamed protein product [Cyclocybe aegerita]|uniref:Uncharacterized protein n=1 Tax=Cyclocybe aegerita TaxID=1973307 RepID=A0A8S0W0R1_CYCAE|nr:unnamed protein product [Cyclocybe aegerita]
MASKGFMGKGKKKREKGTDWFEAGVQGGTILLALVKEAAEFAPVPYLKIAAGTTLKIVTTVQAVKDNKADYQRLAQDATEIIAVVWRSYQKAGDPTWPQDKAEMVTDLVTTLHMILGHVEDQIKRSRTMRVIYSVADTVKIKEYRERLQAAVSKFEVSSHLTIQDVLFQLLKGQQDITARLDNHGQPMPLVVQVHLDEEKAKEEAEEAEERKRIAEMEKVKAEKDAALKEKLEMDELRKDMDRQRMEQEKIAAQLKRWKEQQEEEAELARLKEAQRLREEKRLKAEDERRAKLAKALEEEREEEAKRVEAERQKARAEEKETRRLEKEAALKKKIESHRTKESETLSAKSKSSKAPVIEVSSDEEESLDEDDEGDDEHWEDDTESETESSEDEAAREARLEEERKARKAAKKKSNSAPLPTSPEAAMHNAFAQMGFDPSASGHQSPPLGSPYPGYPPYGGHSPYYGSPGMLSPPMLSTNNSGNVTNMSMSNMGNDNSIRYYGSKHSKKGTRARSR